MGWLPTQLLGGLGLILLSDFRKRRDTDKRVERAIKELLQTYSDEELPKIIMCVHEELKNIDSKYTDFAFAFSEQVIEELEEKVRELRDNKGVWVTPSQIIEAAVIYKIEEFIEVIEGFETKRNKYIEVKQKCFKSQKIPKHVAEFLREELGLSLEEQQVRKCVDRDFVAVLSAILLGDGKLFSHSVYNIADNWRILHVWMPDTGQHMVLIAKFEKFENDYMLEECYMVEEE